MRDGRSKEIDNPAHYPDPTFIQEVERAVGVNAILWFLPNIWEAIMNLGMDKAGILHQDRNYVAPVYLLTYRFPSLMKSSPTLMTN